MSESEHMEFSRILAYQSAPAMLGIKPSSLINVDKYKFCVDENVSYFNRRAYNKGLKIFTLREDSQRKLLLVYNNKLLDKLLDDVDVRKYLAKYGYEYKLSKEECLSRLSKRICENDEFPHEVGVFLGYPIYDVEEFIKNKGENYLICGCWKVYSNEKQAQKLFSNYDKCRSFLCNKLDQGIDIYKALKIS